MEEVGYAVGEVVGFDSIKVASHMDSAVVIFLDQVHKVEQVVEAGIVLRETFTPVYLLMNSSKQINISNALPFIKNDDLCKALSRCGQIVSPIKKVLLGCKSPKLKHVVCHRRQVYVIPKDADSHLNLTLNFKINGFNYIVFISSDTMQCFGCEAEGHLIRACPEARRTCSHGQNNLRVKMVSLCVNAPVVSMNRMTFLNVLCDVFVVFLMNIYSWGMNLTVLLMQHWTEITWSPILPRLLL